MKGDRERCLAAGMDGYLSKPFRPQELFRAVEQFEAAEGESGGGWGTPEAESATKDITKPAALRNAKSRKVVFDKTEALHRVGGSFDIFRELAELFNLECPKQMDRIEQAHREGDLSGLARAAHALKSSVGIFAAKAAHEAALRLEMMGRGEDASDFHAAWDDLQREIERLKSALAAECTMSE
jgi:HPt (histidine-containing phosphotransfer) domain-containing protein